MTLSLVALTTLAAPAGAATPVLANEKFKWFYWIGFILAASLVLWLLATPRRVLRPGDPAQAPGSPVLVTGGLRP